MNQFEHAIKIRGLERAFSGFKLGPLDLNVPRGSIYCFIGPNGAGKTTTIDLMLGMGSKQGGSIEICGLEHSRYEVEIKRRIGYVSPDLNFATWKRVGRALQFVKGFYPDWDDDYCRKLMNSFHLTAEGNIATLSFGERIKLSLIVALSHRPDLLILDEPTVGLDAVSKKQIFAELLAAVREGERTVFISSHGLTDLERFADHVGMIRNGRLLFEGAMDQVVGRFNLVDFIWKGAADFTRTHGVFIQSHQENRYRALIDSEHGGMEWIKSQGAQEITSSPVTLEEVFVTLAETAV